MLKALYDFISFVLKTVITASVLVAAAAGIVTFVYIVIMSCWRIIGLLWRELFSFSW